MVRSRAALLWAGLVMLGGSPLEALSCRPVSVAQSYGEVAAASAPYVIALGRFSFDEKAFRQVPPHNDTPPGQVITARFSGGLFTGKDFSFETELDVEIDARCFGPWCSWLAPELETLAFLEDLGEGGFRLSLSPCGGRAFAEPGPADIEQVLACFNGADCR
ncbi:MAG: hypothetical protein AAF647_04200 [Pseudomonadota bacterium]